MSEEDGAPGDVREVWHPKHRNQTITTASVGGWLLIAVAALRYLTWPEAGPSKLDAMVTAAFLAMGCAAALPKVATVLASLAVQLWPWGTNKDHKDGEQ